MSGIASGASRASWTRFCASSTISLSASSSNSRVVDVPDFVPLCNVTESV